MHRTRRSGRTAVALPAGPAAAVPATAVGASPAGHTRTASVRVRDDVDITGLCRLNANGSTGTLHILSVAQGRVTADFRYDVINDDEHVSGTWDATTRTLALVRPFNPAQVCTLWLGGSNTYPAHPVFGGCFTQGGGRFGTYAEYLWRG